MKRAAALPCALYAPPQPRPPRCGRLTDLGHVAGCELAAITRLETRIAAGRVYVILGSLPTSPRLGQCHPIPSIG
jgi:hypothetical protein